MASFNRVILVGNLTRDPELRYIPSGAAVCNLRLATTRNWKNRESGERQEETEWHRVVLRERLAEIAGEYLKKGRSVYVEGRLKTRKWEKDGKEQYTTEIIATEMQMLGGREGMGGGAASEEGGSYSEGGGGAQRAAPAPASRPAPQRPAATKSSATGFDNMDDDIPF